MSYELNILFRLFVAILLAGALGWEREDAGKSAGVRTHMLVGLSSAFFVELGELFVLHFRDLQIQINSDPIRIIEAVVTGISFFGAGAIFVHRGKDRIVGLTTAASILATAAVGMCVGLGKYGLAVGATILLLIILRGVSYLEMRSNLRE